MPHKATSLPDRTTTAVIGSSGSGKTTLCNLIAHRLKTVRNAGQILVADDSQIVQRGRHKELMGQKSIYADFVLERK